MYYKLHQGVSLVEKHVAQLQNNYDMVIRMRPDMVFHEDLPEFEPNTFYTIQHRNHLGQGTGDLMQVGNLAQMMFFSKIICFIAPLYAQTKLLCPHVITEQHIKNLGFAWKEFNINKTLMHTPKGAYVELDKNA
jgi:hypothetical protein